MNLDPAQCYRALLSHDPRFDGVFFVGVSSTAIYCRTVCPARAPRAERCEYFPSAAAAEREGYRPCLRCRPEMAPGNARVDAAGRLAAAAAGRIEEGALGEGGVERLARGLGVTGRHLRRVVRAEYGVSPIELAQTQRLLLAKRLLTDTTLSVTGVAHASGFRSVRRFNALFRSRYRLKPRDIRRTHGAPQATLACGLAYRPPFGWDDLLRFLEKRAVAGVETVRGGRYLRTVALGTHRGWIAVGHAPGRRMLRVEVAASLAPALPAVLGRVKRLFDLAAEPRRVAEHLGAMGRAGLRVPGAFDGFETAARVVLGQQISVAAARTLAGRLVREFGEAVSGAPEGLSHAWPGAARVAALRPARLAALGIVSARARCLGALARAAADGRIALAPGASVEETQARLRAIPGIGAWTAEVIALRALGWPDAFPHTDLGIRRALGTDDSETILATAEPWRPWRAYAAIALWNSLEEA
ncbi:MAG: helix-turn-helix domain-containing protein [Planctomycetes bacterium]|nr:helix-turn-helix domain-containing protein [Planctomycetota bacterium]